MDITYKNRLCRGDIQGGVFSKITFSDIDTTLEFLTVPEFR